eukprot:COSAG05_NODE_506_length_9178_cov_36.187576_4_plen_192_part_00
MEPQPETATATVRVCGQDIQTTAEELELADLQVRGPEAFSALSRLVNLRAITLSKMTFSDAGWESLVAGIKGSPHLTHLNLTACGLRAQCLLYPTTDSNLLYAEQLLHYFHSRDLFLHKQEVNNPVKQQTQRYLVIFTMKGHVFAKQTLLHLPSRHSRRRYPSAPAHPPATHRNAFRPRDVPVKAPPSHRH